MHLKIVLLDGQGLANAGQFIVIGEVHSHKALTWRVARKSFTISIGASLSLGVL